MKKKLNIEFEEMSTVIKNKEPKFDPCPCGNCNCNCGENDCPSICPTDCGPCGWPSPCH